MPIDGGKMARKKRGTFLKPRCVRRATRAYGPEWGILDTRSNQWYGQGFPDRETANAEIADMKLMPKWQRWIDV